jgi:hypothetical protein
MVTPQSLRSTELPKLPNSNQRPCGDGGSPVLYGQHSKHFQWKRGVSLEASVLSSQCLPSRIGEGRMSFILMIMAVPWLYAMGIYNPQVMHHGHCIAQPGTFAALYCPAPAAPPHQPHR